MKLKDYLNTPMRRMMARNIILTIAVCIGVVYVSNRDNKKLHRRNMIFSTMSTVATVDLVHSDDSIVKDGIAAAHKAIRDVETACNIFDPQSELARLNASAADAPFACGDLLWDVLTQARNFYRDSDSAFDVTIDPLMKLWGFHRKRETLPGADEIAQAKALTGLDKVIFDDRNHTVKFTVPGMSINLGGIAKGYALDRAAAALKPFGIQRGWIEIGGNILALSDLPGNKEYAAGIRNPFRKDTLLGKTSLHGAAISTSGNYERYVVIDGKHYTHIIDPATGLPVEGMASVTVIAKSGTASDAVSTSIFVRGPEAVKKWTELFPDLRVLVIRGTADHPEILQFGKGWDDIPDSAVRNS